MERVGDPLQPAACGEVVVDRLEQRVAVAELRVDGHAGDPDRSATASSVKRGPVQKLLTGCGDDPRSAFLHRRSAASRWYGPRWHVAAFTVLIVR